MRANTDIHVNQTIARFVLTLSAYCACLSMQFANFCAPFFRFHAHGGLNRLPSRHRSFVGVLTHGTPKRGESGFEIGQTSFTGLAQHATAQAIRLPVPAVPGPTSRQRSLRESQTRIAAGKQTTGRDGDLHPATSVMPKFLRPGCVGAGRRSGSVSDHWAFRQYPQKAVSEHLTARP